MFPAGKPGSWTGLLASAICLFCLCVPEVSEAKIACSYNGGNKVLSVTTTGSDEAGLRRFGELILVSPFLESPILCKGAQPTVTNTDRVDVIVQGEGSAWIELEGGPFAPGATAEPDAFSEIEFTVRGSGFVSFEGGPGRDHFRFMDSGRESGVNLNADQDDDLDLVSLSKRSLFLLLVLEGGPGADLIDARGHPSLEMFAVGGKGNDTLVAPGSGSAILGGGKGRDRLLGGQGKDLLVPGAGADVVKARAGFDTVYMRPDQRRDRIDCGGGRDNVGRQDDRDRLFSCERVKGGS
jgi:Ca2+-binding RTX toxin-like protein